MRITISGPPGSGKTTVCKKLSDLLGLKAVVFGKIFREHAAKMNLSLLELSAMAENDPKIDEMIDSEILQIAKKNEDIVLESRLSAYMMVRHGIPAFKVYLDADSDIRIYRIGLREDENIEDARKETLDRQASEAKRYMKYYGIDVKDRSVYDLIVNTDEIDADQVTQKIIEAIRC